MHRLLVLYPMPDDPAAFRDYYESHHLPLAAQMPGLRGYRYGFDAAVPGGGEAPYFCVFEGDFDDAAALDAALASPKGQEVGADVANYATGGAVLVRCDMREGPAIT